MANAESGATRPPDSIRIASFGVTVTPRTSGDIVADVENAVMTGKNLLVGAHNLHSVYLLHTDDAFASFYEAADIVLVDGWPILARLNNQRAADGLPPLPSTYRIGSTDWLLQAMSIPALSRTLVIGASKVSNSGFVERLSLTSDSKTFKGLSGEAWSPDRLHEATRLVEKFQPQLILLGLGMPLQESVALSLRREGFSGVIATIGGAIDQMSGAQKLAPRWTGHMRVEWLWRLLTNPRRLAHRYVVEPVKLASLLRKNAVGK